MRLALEAAGGQPESTAWVLVEISKLDLALGRLARAQRLAREANEALPDYASARVQLARVEAARGDDRAAIANATEAVERASEPAGGLPPRRSARPGGTAGCRAPPTSAGCGDRAPAARERRPGRPGGRRPIAPTSGFVRTETVELARKARAERPSIYGDDALGWALARAGRCSEALPWARARSVSGRRIRSSTSTSATRKAAPVTGPRCAPGTRGRSRSARSSRSAGLRSPARHSRAPDTPTHAPPGPGRTMTA